jgi:hypothetical protein
MEPVHTKKIESLLEYDEPVLANQFRERTQGASTMKSDFGDGREMGSNLQDLLSTLFPPWYYTFRILFFLLYFLSDIDVSPSSVGNLSRADRNMYKRFQHLMLRGWMSKC